MIDTEFIKELPSPLDTVIDKDQEALIFKDVANIDGFMEYLRDTMSLDIKRYFSSPEEQHKLIMGSYYRTKYLYDLCVKNAMK